jgi:hypothetical protein
MHKGNKMTNIDLFLATLALGSGALVTGFVGLALYSLLLEWSDLLTNATEALKRYRCRDMIIKAYYEPEKMRHVREWELPEPYMVELARNFERDGKFGKILK